MIFVVFDSSPLTLWINCCFFVFIPINHGLLWHGVCRNQPWKGQQ